MCIRDRIFYKKISNLTETVEYFENIRTSRNFSHKLVSVTNIEEMVVDSALDAFAESELTEDESEMEFHTNPSSLIVNRLNHQWGTDSSYWKFWTIWEPKFLQIFKQISRIDDGGRFLWKDTISFPNFINQTFSSFKGDTTFQPLGTFSDGVARFAMVCLRIFYNKNHKVNKIK